MQGTDERSGQLHALAHRVTDRPDLPFCTPGLAMVTRRGDGSGERVFVGVDGAGRPIREDTLFALASASKLALGLAVLQLVDEERIALDAPLSRYLPAAAAAQPGVTIRSLLSHTSGLPLDLDTARTPYTRTLDWPALASGCLAVPLATAPGVRVQYSNVAFGLIGIIVEDVTGTDLPTVLERRVFAPLGVEAYIGRPMPRPAAVVVDIDSAHVGTELEPFNSPFWRQLAMPWAGVFTTADGLLTLVQAYAGRRATLLRPTTASEARSDQCGGLSGGYGTTDPFIGFNGSRRIAWPRCAWGLALELRGDKRPHWAPPAAAPESFGQLGASGCLAWYDPLQDVAWAVLAPRTTDNGWLLRHGPAFGTIALQGPAPRGE